MNKKMIILTVVLILFGTGAWIFLKSGEDISTESYQFASIETGNLENLISSTGTLSPLTTVDIGTQVSGTIDSVFVDYNDAVSAGQILAVLDTFLLKASVKEAEANLNNFEASLEEAQYNYDLNKRLFDRGMISESDLFPFTIALKAKKAAVKSAEAQLDRARQNLDYAIIRSPINGTVISKNIESGQTVAASLSTPTLFEVAEDLSRMEILVDVDESDIGQIKPGQEVRFEVQSYDNIVFEGFVRQVRLQPTTISNVVTYTAVVDAENLDNLLLPGMTATVDFVVDSRENTLLVSNKALRFKPDESTMATFFEAKQKERIESKNSKVRGNDEPAINDASQKAQVNFAVEKKYINNQPPGNTGMVWFIDEKNELQMARLRTGISDGLNTEIIDSPVLKKGTKVIVGFIDKTEDKESKSNQQGSLGGGFRTPRGF